MDDQSQHTKAIEPSWTLIRMALVLFGIGGFAITTFLLFAYGWSPALLIFLFISVPPFFLAVAGWPVSWFSTGIQVYAALMPAAAEHRGIRVWLRSARSGNGPAFDWMFNAALIVVMLIVGFSIPAEVTDKIQLAMVLFVASLLTIYSLQPQLKNSPRSLSDFLWLLFGGAALTVFSMRLVPIWLTASSLMLRGEFAEAGRQLNSHPHANFFLFVGLALMFASIVGIIKLGIAKLLRTRA